MATHVSMNYSLIMILLAISCLLYIDAEMQVTRQQLKEIDRYLKRMNKPAVKSIKSPDGDIIDCVHILHQPAFDHPLLKNHTIQMRPSSNPFGVDNEDEVASEKEIDSIHQRWRRYGRCPEDTIPIRRIKRDDLLRAGPALNFSRLSHRALRYPILADTVYGSEDARAQLYGGVYRGTNVVINVWSPKVEVGDNSRAFLTLMSGSGGDINLIEAGWMVDSIFYDDDKPRLSISWTSDDYEDTGCFNLCSGFVQTGNQVAVGAPIEPVSTYDGTQYEVEIGIWEDAKSKNWWFAYQNYTVGYFPNSILTNLGDGANFIFWGGTVYALNPDSRPHTTTMMGSGHFPEEGFQKASFFKRIQYLDSDWALQRPSKLDMIRQRPNCYNVTLGEDLIGDSGVYLYYGGPGRNPNCP